MPAKAAGTTMKEFAKKCSPIKMPDNVLNLRNRIEKLTFTFNYEFPSIIASHSFSPGPFIDLMKSSTRETLIIYSHREESSRFRSAIQHVITRICSIPRAADFFEKQYNFTIERNNSRCTIDEEHLIRIIKDKQHEIGLGSPELLTCDFFEAVAQIAPSNLVFVHYKQADKLQKVLANYHCPHIMKQLPIASNVAADKKMEPFVRLKKDKSREVTLKEWYDTKQGIILWALDLKNEMKCQSKITDMEDHMFSCPDETVTLIHGEYICVSFSE